MTEPAPHPTQHRWQAAARWLALIIMGLNLVFLVAVATTLLTDGLAMERATARLQQRVQRLPTPAAPPAATQDTAPPGILGDCQAVRAQLEALDHKLQLEGLGGLDQEVRAQALAEAGCSESSP